MNFIFTPVNNIKLPAWIHCPGAAVLNSSTLCPLLRPKQANPEAGKKPN